MDVFGALGKDKDIRFLTGGTCQFLRLRGEKKTFQRGQVNHSGLRAFLGSDSLRFLPRLEDQSAQPQLTGQRLPSYTKLHPWKLLVYRPGDGRCRSNSFRPEAHALLHPAGAAPALLQGVLTPTQQDSDAQWRGKKASASFSCLLDLKGIGTLPPQKKDGQNWAPLGNWEEVPAKRVTILSTPKCTNALAPWRFQMTPIWTCEFKFGGLECGWALCTWGFCCDDL